MEQTRNEPAKLVFLLNFSAAVGGKADEWETPMGEPEQAEAEKINALDYGSGHYRHLQYLRILQYYACRENLIKAYKENKISPGLRELLETPPPNWETLPGNAGKTWNQVLFGMAEQGRADFSFLKGEKGTDKSWLMRYKIANTPFPRITKNIKALEVETPKEKAELLAILTNSIKAEITTNENPEIKQNIKALLDLIEGRYNRYKAGKYDLKNGSIAKAGSRESNDFYLNPATGKVTDLRPYAEEIERLLSPVSWEYLKLFVKTGKAALKKEKKQEPKKSIFDNPFIKMFNSTPTNNIVAINSSKSGRPAGESGYFEQNMFTEEWEYRQGKTELNLPMKTFDGHVLPPAFATSTWKLMHFLTIIFTIQNSHSGSGITPEVETSVREYMAATGRNMTANTVKETTKIVKKDLELLNEIKLKHNDKKYSLNQVRPFPGVHLNRGKIRVTLDNDFAKYLSKTTGFLINYPAALLRLKENNSNLYPLGYKLALNRSNDTNIRSGKANILSVPVCLEFCPSIPPITKVRKEGRSPNNRIIEPFEKAMDALQQQGVLERWEYCLPKGEPLGKAAVTDYNYFVTLYVLYEIKDFPIRRELPRIQSTAEKRQKRKERQERETDKAIARMKAKEILENKAN